MQVAVGVPIAELSLGRRRLMGGPARCLMHLIWAADEAVTLMPPPINYTALSDEVTWASRCSRMGAYAQRSKVDFLA